MSVSHPSYESLQPYLGVSQINLWHCPNCTHRQLPSSVSSSPDFCWGVVLTCGVCCCSWLVCTECSNVKSPFLTPMEGTKHNRRKHRNGKVQVVSELPLESNQVSLQSESELLLESNQLIFRQSKSCHGITLTSVNPVVIYEADGNKKYRKQNIKSTAFSS